MISWRCVQRRYDFNIYDKLSNGKKDNNGNFGEGTPFSSFLLSSPLCSQQLSVIITIIVLSFQPSAYYPITTSRLYRQRKKAAENINSNSSSSYNKYEYLYSANRHTYSIYCMPSSSAAAAAGHHAFSGLRQRARRELVGVRHSGVITDRLKDGPKYVSLGSLKSAFGAAGLTFSEDEAEYVVKRFADNR